MIHTFYQYIVFKWRSLRNLICWAISNISWIFSRLLQKSQKTFRNITEREKKWTYHSSEFLLQDLDSLDRRDSESFCLPPERKWSHSVVSDSVTPWTVAYQALLSMGFFRQGYWSGLPFPSPGDLPNPGIKPGLPTLQSDALSSEPPGKGLSIYYSSCMSWYLFSAYVSLLVRWFSCCKSSEKERLGFHIINDQDIHHE